VSPSAGCLIVKWGLAIRGQSSLLRSDLKETLRKMKIENFSNTNPKLSSEQKGAKDRMIELLSAGKIDLALEVKQKANLPEQEIQSQEVREVIEKQFAYFVSAGLGYLAQELIEGFNVSKELADKAARKGIIWALEHLESGDFDNIVIPMSEEFHLVLDTEELVQAAKIGIDRLSVRVENNNEIKRIKNFFGIKP